MATPWLSAGLYYNKQQKCGSEGKDRCEKFKTAIRQVGGYKESEVSAK